MGKPTRQLIPEGLEKIKNFESLRLFAYPDPATPLAKAAAKYKPKWGFRHAREILAELERKDPKLMQLSGRPWTCGYGSTKGVSKDTVWTEEEALEALDSDLDDAQLAVERLVTVPLTDYQYAALVSLVFNIGSGNFATSTLLKKLNARDYLNAADRFEDWIKARNRETGRLEVLNGLKTRRAIERALFLRGAFVESNTSVPVEDTPSSQNQVGRDANVTVPAVTMTGALLAALSEAASQVQALAAYSETMKSVFIGLTLLGVVITLTINLRKRKEARKENNP